MKTINLSGGLGNQMFQVAFGEWLSQVTGDEVIYSTKLLNNRFSRGTIRDLEVNKISPRLLIIQKKMGVFGWLWFHLLCRFKKLRQVFRVCIEQPHDQGLLLSYCADSYFGYWQKLDYAKSFGISIFDLFAIPESRLAVLTDYFEVISSYGKTPVAAHVRRGDYVSNATANKKHGVLQNDYYSEAVNAFPQSKDEYVFVIFTDDKFEAIRIFDALGVDFILIVDECLNLESHEEIILMSLFKYLIIANSTFSWWGAFLASVRYDDSVTVCPERWFNNDVISGDLIMERWIVK